MLVDIAEVKQMMWADDSFAQREVAGEAESSKALYYIVYSYIAILYTTN